MLTPERWQKVRDVLEQAMELAPEKRPRFLDVACSSDPSLRSEVQSLLSADEKARSSFLESPPLSPAALAPGTKLGDYEIVSQIGSGGMGVVYRAKDLRLGRDVAIKVLPAHLSSDTSRLRRFEQEAQSAAALNHPNILAVHQLGTYLGAPYLVSELLEGKTLREGLRQGALQQQRAMDYAEQIADGLNAAHERGIIHRDLKPENLFVTKENRVKILDFGLAKLALGDSESAETVATIGLQTHPGMIAGTVGYMSPEQVRGEKLDVRTDLFSFGVVLYEMATGKRPFDGDTSGVTFEAILNRQPTPPTKVNAKVAPGLENIIAKALEKDRDIRYQHASDIRADLKRLRRDTESGHSASYAASTRKKSRGVYWLAPIAAILLLSSIYLMRNRIGLNTQPKRVLRERELTANQSDNLVYAQIISPDGKQLLFKDRENVLTLLQIDTGEKRVFPGWKDFWPQSWYPDGTHLLMAGEQAGEHRGLWKASTLDGTSRKLVDLGEPIYGALSPDGSNILFLWTSRVGEIWMMGPEGQDPHVLLSVAPNQIWSLNWAPNSKRIVYLRSDDPTKSIRNEFVIETADLQTLEKAIRLKVGNQTTWGGSDVSWLPDGRVLYILSEPTPNDRYSNLWALYIDPETGRLRGQPTQVTTGIGHTELSISASRDGQRLTVLRAENLRDTTWLAKIDARGTQADPQVIQTGAWDVYPLKWVSDELFLTANPQGKWGLYKFDLHRRDLRFLLSLPDSGRNPSITSNDQWVLYTERSSQQGDQHAVRLMRAPITGGAATLVLNGDFSYRCASHADICVLKESENGRTTFYYLDPLKGRGARLLESDRLVGSEWTVSPDGNSVAYLESPAHKKIEIMSLDGKHNHSIETHAQTLARLQWPSEGRLYAFAYLENNRVELTRFSPAGESIVLLKPSKEQILDVFRVSPDEKYIAYCTASEEWNVVLLESF